MKDSNELAAAADFLENIVASFGPEEGIEMTQDMWELTRAKIIVLLKAVR